MKKNDIGTAYMLWALTFIGLAGMHRFYVGKIGTGLLFLFTYGLFGLGTIYDAFTLSRQVEESNGVSSEPKERSNSNYI